MKETEISQQWGIRFPDGTTSTVGTQEQAAARMKELEALVALGAVSADSVAGMELLETTPAPPAPGLAKDMELILVKHTLEFDHEGDGHTEPLGEHSYCVCATDSPGYSAWQQTDPAHTGYQAFREESDALHRGHLVALLLAAVARHEARGEVE